MSLISKKDLLAITGISYGQLYRWKRERLIPEEWFLKQSAYTGQETFFPREQILSRIQSILELKDQYSLEELANILSPESSVAQISLKELQEITEINDGIRNILPETLGKERFDFYEVAFAIAISKLAAKINLTGSEIENIMRKSIPAVYKQKSSNTFCTVFRVGNEYHTVIYPNSLPIEFDEEIEVIEQLSLSEMTEIVKVKYKHLFMK